MAKRKIYKIYPTRKYIIILLFIFLFIGIGYSVFNMDLNLFGSVTVKGHCYPDGTLYSVLECELKNDGDVLEYTGSHQDSFTTVGNQKIYYWHAEDNDTGTNIKSNKNNVIFGGYCWQMIRTTDTGGVKLIYNGEVDNNQCLDTRGNHMGYSTYVELNLSSTYWYGTDYTYDRSNNTFTLAGTLESKAWNDTNASSLIGKYTCKSTSQTGTCSTLYLVDAYKSSTVAYSIGLKNNVHMSQIGVSTLGGQTQSLADTSYMYNKTYLQHDILNSEEKVYEADMFYYRLSNYWFADSISWDSSTGKYSLVNPYKLSSVNDVDYKYTFHNESATATSSYARYITNHWLEDDGHQTLDHYSYMKLENGHDYAYYNNTFTYGDSFTDNGNGTYTINNPTTIDTVQYGKQSPNLKYKYVCKNANNDTCADAFYVITPSLTQLHFAYVYNNFLYAKGFTYQNGKYNLNNESYQSLTFDLNALKDAHYTCWNSTGECTKLSFIYGAPSSAQLWYIELENGKSSTDAINEMLYNDDVNQKDSTLKREIDEWYRKNLFNYSTYLEDTIFCEKKSQTNASTNGWNYNGGNLLTSMYFSSTSDTDMDLSCGNVTDQFSISNNKARLTYKIGLMTMPEAKLLNNSNVLKTGKNYWLMTPSYYNYVNPTRTYITSSGTLSYLGSTYNPSTGVRPVISLRPGVEYSSGTGSMSDPYIIDASLE